MPSKAVEETWWKKIDVDVKIINMRLWVYGAYTSGFMALFLVLTSHT